MTAGVVGYLFCESGQGVDGPLVGGLVMDDELKRADDGRWLHISED